MTDELDKHAEELSKFLSERDLGGVCFIVSKETLASITVLPKWGILQFSKKGKTSFSLSKTDSDDVVNWLEKAERTAFFLEAVMKASTEVVKMFSKVVTSLEELFAQASAYAEEKDNTKSKTLH